MSQTIATADTPVDTKPKQVLHTLSVYVNNKATLP